LTVLVGEAKGIDIKNGKIGPPSVFTPFSTTGQDSEQQLRELSGLLSQTNKRGVPMLLFCLRIQMNS
jgi:hypothetical protein